MEAGITPEERATVINAIDRNPVLARLLYSMVEAVETRELAAESNGALVRASDTLPEPKITATATGVSADLPDTRQGFAPHHAYLFSVAPSKGTVLDELKTLLGEQAANRLATDWGDRCDLNQNLPETQVALFLDSNNKARNRDYADMSDKTTQEEDFKATGHQFAGDLAATLLCARIFKKAQDGGALSEGEKDLYQKLKDGVLRSCSGALDIDDVGRLRANRFGGSWDSYRWALGSPLSPELK
ncbi:MAG: hypothetical protein ACK5GN_09240 [Pseudomonadota bacterium]|jgi:hypothetical protein